MKKTGIVRKIDELGRIVLPIEIRRSLDMNTKDEVEILVEDGTIVLKKYQPNCIFCGSEEDTVEYKGKLVCKKCMKALSAKPKA